MHEQSTAGLAQDLSLANLFLGVCARTLLRFLRIAGWQRCNGRADLSEPVTSSSPTHFLKIIKTLAKISKARLA